MTDSNLVCIIGGGIAGLTRALHEVNCGKKVILLEQGDRLGGRCGSFYDAPSARFLDYCPHVFLNCCPAFKALMDETSLTPFWKMHAELNFYPPETTSQDAPSKFTECSALPGLLRFLPALRRLKFFTALEKIQLVRELLALKSATSFSGTFQQWLDARKSTGRLSTRFYEPVILSALSCELDKASFETAKMVFDKSFFQQRNGWNFALAKQPLGTIFGERFSQLLRSKNVAIRTKSTVRRLILDSAQNRVTAAELSSGERIEADSFVLAADFRNSIRLIKPLSELKADFVPRAISCVHFWTQKPVVPVRHAIFLERLIQWLFIESEPTPAEGERRGYYSQSVISASDGAIGDRSDPMSETNFNTRFLDEIHQINPDCQVLRYRTIHFRNAVFEPSEQWHQAQKKIVSPYNNLTLIGDWTSPRWPATMEAAVESSQSPV